MAPPPAGLRCPPVNKKGILTRRAVTIPKNQAALLEDQSSWFSNIKSMDALATQAFKAIPDDVREQVQTQHKQSSVSATTTTATTAPRAADPAGDGDSEPQNAATRELPSTISVLSLQVQVSPPPGRAALPSTAPPAATTRPASSTGLADPTAQLGSLQHAKQPVPTACDRSSPPCLDRDTSTSASPDKRIAQLQIAETTNARASEIPATPEKDLQRQSQQAPIYSPEWDEIEDDEDQEMEEDCSYDAMQEDEADQDEVDQDDVLMSQAQTEPPASAAGTTGTTTATPQTNRDISPNLSSSPNADIEYRPVQALAHGSSQACGPAITHVQPPQTAAQQTDAMAVDAASHAPRRRLSPAPPSRSQAMPVTKQAIMDLQRSAPPVGTHRTPALPSLPSPGSNTSRAPSEDGVPGVRRRLMKAPLLPSASKTKIAAWQAHPHTGSPGRTMHGAAYASRKRSSLAQLYASTTARDTSSAPSTAGSGDDDATDRLDVKDARRRDTVRETVEWQTEDDVDMEGRVVTASSEPVSSTAPLHAAAFSARGAAAPTAAQLLAQASAGAYPAVFSPAASPAVAIGNAAVTVTPAFKVRGPVYSASGSNSPIVTPAAACALHMRESPSMSPLHTWMLPYETFTAAYPDYTGDLEDFLRACYCLQGISKARKLASYQYDDVIRSYIDYIEYVHDAVSATPLNLHHWYIENTSELLYNKNVVTRSNVNAILMAYADKVQSIQLIAEPATVAEDKSASTPASTADVVQPPVVIMEMPDHDNSIEVSRDNSILEVPDDDKNDDKNSNSNNAHRQPTQPEPAQPAPFDQAESTTPSQPLSFPAGRRLSIDEVHGRQSQDGSGPSNSNSLLNMSILGSSGESVWRHGQLSSLPGEAHEHNLTQSQFLSQVSCPASQDDDPSQPSSVAARPDSQIPSSCLTHAENELRRSGSPMAACAPPPGVDRIAYMLQSPPTSTNPLLRPHIPSQMVESMADHPDGSQGWGMSDDGNSVAETPAKKKTRTPASAQANKENTLQEPTIISPERMPVRSQTSPAAKATAVHATPIARKRSWDDRSNQLAGSAADMPAGDTSGSTRNTPRSTPKSTPSGVPRDTPRNTTEAPDGPDDQRSGDKHIKTEGVQPAQEEPRTQKPLARDESRRASAAGSDTGIIARLAAAEDALDMATQGITVPAPAPAKTTATATATPAGPPVEPPAKKRKQVGASKKTISRKALADFLAKRAEVKGLANKPRPE